MHPRSLPCFARPFHLIIHLRTIPLGSNDLLKIYFLIFSFYRILLLLYLGFKFLSFLLSIKSTWATAVVGEQVKECCFVKKNKEEKE